MIQPKYEKTLAGQAIRYDDIRALKAGIKVGSKIKVRTTKGATGIDEKINHDSSIIRIGTVTAANHKRFVTLKYETGIIESFLWSEILMMIRNGRCAIVKR